MTERTMNELMSEMNSIASKGAALRKAADWKAKRDQRRINGMAARNIVDPEWDTLSIVPEWWDRRLI